MLENRAKRSKRATHRSRNNHHNDQRQFGGYVRIRLSTIDSQPSMIEFIDYESFIISLPRHTTNFTHAFFPHAFTLDRLMPQLSWQDCLEGPADVITLDRRPDRWRSNAEQLRRAGFNRTHHWPVFDGSTGNAVEHFQHFRINKLAKIDHFLNLLTDLPKMTISTDRVDPDWIKRPHRWSRPFIRHFMLGVGLVILTAEVTSAAAAKGWFCRHLAR
jgi:hypothetical protein